MSEKIDVLGWFDSFIERNGLDQDGDAAKSRATVAELIEVARMVIRSNDMHRWGDSCQPIVNAAYDALGLDRNS